MGARKRAALLAEFVLLGTALLGPLGGRALAQDVAPVNTDTGAAGAREAAGKKIVLGYKPGEWWPLSCFEGADLVEPFLPIAAASRGDVGRLTLNTGLPYALLVSSFAFKSKDDGTSREIRRWKWAGIDEASDNYPMLYGLVVLGGLSLLLPAPEDGDGYSWHLRLDRALVFALGVGVTNIEVEILKPIFNRVRPNGEGHDSRPSGHAATAFAAMAFMSDVLRDTFRPEEAPNLGLRIVEELGCAVPYLGAGYMALERIHGNKHFLTDTLLGGALGVFTTNLFYSWSFTRSEQGRSWLELASIGYDPDQKGLELALRGSF